ncbi:hypothetical protein C1H76_1950 [Elsinoe australis]|uniref:ABM domain-containing protein n=1 Tax=Elsinoe australis TaxID=40998 RepID=A0A2P7ZZZ4_9PEZI|nr:hypothetical protein B9Z65_7600 [Elsinoe australis]TKX25804.1 hypothetical protein C1H76_1950 [Elsinoe australis]
MVYTLVVHVTAKDDAAVPKLHAKLVEAALVYNRDKGTIDWFVMQEEGNPKNFTVVERYESKDATKTHMENPYWSRFNDYFIPLIVDPMDLRRYDELLPQGAGAESRKFGSGVIPDDKKVDEEPEVWKKIDKYQSHLREQGNY